MRSPRVRFEEFELDTAQVQLLRAGEPVHLTPMAFPLLTFLIEAAPRAAITVARNWPAAGTVGRRAT